MPVSIDTYGFRKNAISQELQDRLTSGACVACAGEVGEDYSRLCRDCMVQLAEKGEEILSPEVASYLYNEFDPVRNLGMDLAGWAEESLGNEEREGEVPLASQEVLTDPKKIEDKYRQVGEDEWKWEREGPVGTRTMEKLYPGSVPKNIQDLGGEHVPQPTPEYSDWLERKELGGKKRPQDEETYLTPVEPVESQLSVRHKTAVEPMSMDQRRMHEKQVEEFMEKQKREKTEHEKKEDNEKARIRMERLRQDRAIEEGEQEGLILKPGAMCANHKDIPASFVLQTQILKQSGMPPRMPLCPFCAAKLDIVDLPPSEGQTCINAEYHVENPKSDPIAMRMLIHEGVIDKDAPPLPLCKDCASPFSIVMRPLNEEAEVKYSKMVPLANRDKKAYVLNQLMKLANLLDSKGLYAEANEIDGLIRQAGEWDKEYGSHLPPGEWKAETEGFMRDMETGQRAPAFLDDMVCPDCNEPMPLQVLRSGGGYYLGRTCKNCGPWGRDSGYFKSEKEAEKALEEYKNR